MPEEAMKAMTDREILIRVATKLEGLEEALRDCRAHDERAHGELYARVSEAEKSIASIKGVAAFLGCVAGALVGWIGKILGK